MTNILQVNNLIFRPRIEISPPVWDKFVDESPQAWLWHQWDSQDAIDTWPGKSDLSFALIDEEQSGEIVALMPLHKINRPFAKLFSNCILESSGGMAYSSTITPNQLNSTKKQLIDHLFAIAKGVNAESIDISLTPMAPAYRGNACPKINPLIFYSFQNTSTQTYVIELNQSLDAIWKNLDSYCRTHIRKAEKSGVVVREAIGDRDLQIYYDLHCSTYRRTGAVPHPFAYFKKIWDSFLSNGKAKVFFVEKDGKVIAADNEAVYKQAVSGWTAAGLNNIVPGVNNLLHWNAIQWAQSQKFDFYESGEGFPGEVVGKRKGLTDFKKSFGGELYPFFRGSYIRRGFLHNSRNLLKSLRNG